MRLGILYLCRVHIVPSTLIISGKNECLGTILAVKKGEQIDVVDSDTTQ